MPRRFLALLIPVFALGWARADGPKDNVPDNVRPVPPKGAKVAENDLTELKAGLAELQKELDGLKGNELLPDVEVYHKAVRYAVEFDELYVDKGRNDVATAKAHLKTGLKRAKELKVGQPSWTKATGVVVRGYRSKIDGSVQPYGLVIPKEYDDTATNKHRLDFWWHGRFENILELSFIADREKNAGQFTPAGAIVVHPFGRFSNANKFAGEIDSLEILDQMKKHYRIDESRIVARGFSMGGAACWQYAVHYPTLFCAAAPGAGFAETKEFLGNFQNEVVKPTWYEEKLWRMYDATESAQNIFNIPTVAYSGEIDKQKQAADVMAREMKKVGLELTHIIGPKTGHSYEKNAKEEVNKRIDAIVAKGKDPFPKEIKFTTYSLRYNQCAWLKIDELEKHWEPATVIGSHDGAGNFTLQTKGVVELTITSPQTVQSVTVDGNQVKLAALPGNLPKAEHTAAKPDVWRFRRKADRWVPLTHDDDKALQAQLRKVSGLQGPIDDAFMDSFVFYKPSQEAMHESTGKWTDGEMNRAAKEWRRQFRGDLVLHPSTEFVWEDVEMSNMVLWGDPQSNPVIAKVMKKLPIKWDRDTIEYNGTKYDAKTHMPVLIFPNPLNPKKYVVLNSGFTYREYDYLNNARQVPKLPDYAVVDVTTPANSRWPGKVVRAGFFNEKWELQADDGK